MAHDSHAQHAQHAHGGDAGHADGHHGPEGDTLQYHPTAGQYVKIGIFLTIITAIEVAAYYIPAWVAHWSFVPSLVIMSAVKFATVVLLYMHLKFDHKLFRALFVGPFIIAALTIIGLMFLFGVFAARTGALV